MELVRIRVYSEFCSRGANASVQILEGGGGGGGGRHIYYTTTVFIRIVAVATINFAPSSVRLLIEGGSYSRVATIYFARAQ